MITAIELVRIHRVALRTNHNILTERAPGR
jgi:hypothetical protein